MNAITKHATRTAVSVTGLRKAYGEKVVFDGVDLTIGERRGRRIARAKRGRQDHDRTDTLHLIPVDASKATVMGHDLRGEAGAVRRVIGITGQFSAVDDLLTGEENLVLMGRLLHLRATERRARATELLERFDLVEAGASDAGHLLRRHEAAPRPRNDPDGAATADLPR